MNQLICFSSGIRKYVYRFLCVKKMGGEIVRGKIQIGEFGYAAYLKDPEGNIIGLWQKI